MWTPLATHSRACQVQTGIFSSPVTVRTGDSLLGRWLLPGVWQHSALSAACRRSNMRSSTNTQQLQWINICGRQSSSVEFFPHTSCIIQTLPMNGLNNNWRDTILLNDEQCVRLLPILGALEKHLLTYLQSLSIKPSAPMTALNKQSYLAHLRRSSVPHAADVIQVDVSVVLRYGNQSLSLRHRQPNNEQGFTEIMDN